MPRWSTRTGEAATLGVLEAGELLLDMGDHYLSRAGGLPNEPSLQVVERWPTMTGSSGPNRNAYGYRQGASVILLAPDDTILVCRLRSEFVPKAVLPSGGIETGEDVMAAGLRELQEETGIAPKSIRVVGVSDRYFRYDLVDEQFNKWIKRGSHFRGQEKHYVVATLDDSVQLPSPTEPAIAATMFVERSGLADALNHPDEAALIEQILRDFGL